ncbi:MAG: alpha/beta hydrolase [Bacteroidales bacterium]|nr:alpha/beta hydrolase [Bacteroidales bacterium]
MKHLRFQRFLISLVLCLCLVSSCRKENPIQVMNMPEVQYAEISGATIAYKVYGKGEPLLLCTGYATNMDLWSGDVIDILQQRYQVIVFDYRGMGFSTNADSSFTIECLGEDVNALMTVLNISKAHLMGWSMGGFVAQMFALNHPEKVAKLVLYATNCGDTITMNPSQEIIDILENPASTPLEMLSTLFPDDWMAAHAEPWTFLPEAKEPYNGETIGMQYGAIQQWLSPGGGSAGRLHSLTMPVLLICGKEDKVVPCINSSILADSIPGASIIQVEATGHGMMYQMPQTFGHYVATFLESESN